ncbi:RNA polymerase sigma factor [Spirochaeta cellobiosiphila]|uniref:RNA polymerase sigma factor n=1 Tax=Spirochaeta cellobiosiphila TaxID=504483 RepID=UPI00041908EF|nr:sigma-70 family RNA polymerase sigma factor [Spirochaeta cellobiosiphila]
MPINVEDLYRKYGPMVHRRCLALLKDEDRALDATQDVFLLLVRKENKLEDKGLSSLLYTMATNVCLNIMRKDKRSLEIYDGDQVVLTVAASDRTEEQVLTKHFLEQLFTEEKSSTQTIAVLHYVDGFTLQETAKMVGMSVSGIQKRLRLLKDRGIRLKEK